MHFDLSEKTLGGACEASRANQVVQLQIRRQANFPEVEVKVVAEADGLVNDETNVQPEW